MAQEDRHVQMCRSLARRYLASVVQPTAVLTVYVTHPRDLDRLRHYLTVQGLEKVVRLVDRGSFVLVHSPSRELSMHIASYAEALGLETSDL